jgi:hypothetical protein
MKAKKIIIEFDEHEPVEIILNDFEVFNLSQTNGISEGFDEKTNSIKKIPNGRRYVTIRITPRDETDYFEYNPR